MTSDEVRKLNRLVWSVAISSSALNMSFQIYGIIFSGVVGAGILILGLAMSLVLAAISFSMIIIGIFDESANVT